MKIKDSVLNVVNLVPIRHPSRDVEYALGHRVLECRGEVQVEYVFFGVYLWYLNTQLNEITLGVGSVSQGRQSGTEGLAKETESIWLVRLEENQENNLGGKKKSTFKKKAIC